MKSLFSITIIAVLIILVIIGVLTTGPLTGVGRGVGLYAAASNTAGVAKLCSMIQVDENSGDTNLSAWPGRNSASLGRWMNSLANYGSTNELLKMFSAGGLQATSWMSGKGPDINSYYIYPVSADSPENTVLMTSRNYRLPTSGNGPALVATDKPFGTNGAIVVKKSGSSQVIPAWRATNDVSTIGIVEGAPLN